MIRSLVTGTAYAEAMATEFYDAAHDVSSFFTARNGGSRKGGKGKGAFKVIPNTFHAGAVSHQFQ